MVDDLENLVLSYVLSVSDIHDDIEGCGVRNVLHIVIVG
jgi:hypothetical protein